MSGKLKMLKRGLKEWSKELSKLNKLINNSSFVLAMIDGWPRGAEDPISD
jgi:hypothetical protein